MNEMNDRIDAVLEAQDLLSEALDAIKQAIRGLGCQPNIEAYFTDHLEIMISGDHRFLSRNKTCDDIIDQIREEFEEDDDL